jgi:hypothetical protein
MSLSEEEKVFRTKSIGDGPHSAKSLYLPPDVIREVVEMLVARKEPEQIMRKLNITAAQLAQVLRMGE